MKYYVIDDEQPIVSALTVLLESAGHEVKGFTSSVEALNLIKVDPPEIIITDIMMPEMDGLELCRRIRDIPEFANIRIIVSYSPFVGQVLA